jgi:hypothetical protein
MQRLDAKAEAFKKTTQITSGIEVRDPSTKVFIGPVTSIPAGQSFPSADYHAQLTCERNEMGQLRPTLFTAQYVHIAKFHFARSGTERHF